MKLPIFLNSLVMTIIIINFVESKMTMDQIKNTLRPYKNSCIRKTSVDLEFVNDAIRGNFIQDKLLMCFFRCLMQKLKFLKEGEIDDSTIIAQIEMLMADEYVPRLKELSKKCCLMASKVEESCEAAYVFVKCYYETEPDLFLLSV